ncbi:MAG: hypothetical protein AAGG48_20130 [Planctomycetota bacterium]
MKSNSLNPYQIPETRSVQKGYIRFRLRLWFALTLYLLLASDFALIWTYGFRPFVVSIPVFMVILIASIFSRRFAYVRLDQTGVEYRDLVQLLGVSWDRVVRVTHKNPGTVIETDSPIARFTISRHLDDYQVLMRQIEDLQHENDFGIRDLRKAF